MPAPGCCFISTRTLEGNSHGSESPLPFADAAPRPVRALAGKADFGQGQGQIPSLSPLPRGGPFPVRA